ncbi:MAG: peptidoglycan-binding protein [Myxococcaceae bacterium]
MSAVAGRFGVSLTQLIRVNPSVRNPSLINPGDRLRIPGRDSFQPSAPAARTRTQANQPAPTLHRGSTGPAVRELQNRLHTLGYLTTAALATGPGVFGPRTELAVKQFQSKHKIKTTGVVGSYTQAAISKALQDRKAQQPTSAPAPSGHGYKGQYNGHVPAASVRNVKAWEPVNAPVKSTTGNRSAARYADVLNQFAVGVNPRYRPRSGNTYCNIFVWDATKAMGAEIPHWWHGHELDANSVNSWLHQNGVAHGWRRVDAKTAQQFANAGRPSVASWRNPGGIGHVAMVRPGSINAAGPASAQAGARNFNYGHIANGFGSRHPEYWVHA